MVQLITDGDLSDAVYDVLSAVTAATILFVFAARASRLATRTDHSSLHTLLASDPKAEHAVNAQRCQVSCLALIPCALNLTVFTASMTVDLVAGTSVVPFATSVCCAASWGLATTLVTIEWRSGVLSGSAIRVWWLLWFALATCFLQRDLRHSTDCDSSGICVAHYARIGSYAGSLVLALLALLQSDSSGLSVSHPQSKEVAHPL